MYQVSIDTSADDAAAVATWTYEWRATGTGATTQYGQFKVISVAGLPLSVGG